MQRVIDRKLNDTDRAERIDRHAANTDRGDFYYLIESLYKTSEGEYFLHCKGGAALNTRNRVMVVRLQVKRSTSSIWRRRLTGAKNAQSTVRPSSKSSAT